MATVVIHSKQPSGSAPTVPVKFVKNDAATLLARDWLWEKLPTVSQLALYRREDGAYFCAIAGCDIAAPPQRKNDQMVTIGPLVFCHEHGNAVLRQLKDNFDVNRDKQRGERCQWYYLSKTLYHAEGGDSNKIKDAADGREENRRAAGAAKEMAERAARLEMARKWALGHIAWVERTRSEEAARQDVPVAEVPRANGAGAPEARPEPADQSTETVVDQVPPVEHYAGMNARDLAKAKKGAQASLVELAKMREADHITQAAFNQHKLVFHAVLERIAQVDKRKALDRIAQMKKKLGIGSPPGPKVEIMGQPQPRDNRRAGVAQRAPAKGGLMVACNMSSALNGNPHEGVLQLRFGEANFPDHQACNKALDETGDPWRQLLVDHAPEGAQRDEALRNGSQANKAAKKQAKDCLLHGPKARVLGSYRGAVIRHYSANWPTAWAERMAAVRSKANGQVNGNGSSALPCAMQDCVKPASQQVQVQKPVTDADGQPKMQTVIKRVCKACKNQITRPARDARKRAANAAKAAKDGRKAKGGSSKKGRQ